MKKEGNTKFFRFTLKMHRKCKRLKIEISEYDVGFFLPSHVSARESKYHHGRNQFAAAVDSLKGLSSLIGEIF